MKVSIDSDEFYPVYFRSDDGHHEIDMTDDELAAWHSAEVEWGKWQALVGERVEA
jgi:hypothetical protein